METNSMSMVVPEVLNDNNYLHWSVRIRTYLMARDLWEIVEGTTDDDEPPTCKAWKTKNFMALHVIQNGCGPEPLHLIRNINSAKTAWDVLAKTYNIQPPLDPSSVFPEIVLEDRKVNYLDWSARVRKYLIAIEAWDTIVNEPPKKEVDGVDAFKAWRKKDLLALHVIHNACGQWPIIFIRKENSAKDAWRVLAREFGPKPKDTTGVRQLLDKENYDTWSVCVKTYLELRDLWYVVVKGEDPSVVEHEDPSVVECEDTRVVDNTTALDVIRESCGPTMRRVIKGCDSAKDAWEKLREAAEADRKLKIECEFGFIRSAIKELQKVAMKRDWSAMMDCLKKGPCELLIAKISGDGDTALHWAVLHDNTRIVKQLVELMSAKELETENNKGVTALAQVAACGNIQMAECMLNKNSKLISIPDGKNRIPVIRALEYGATDIARYLYEHTPLQVLESNTAYVPTLVASCIFANAFDIALDFIKQSEITRIQLFYQDIYGNSLLSALASQPSISLSRSRLLFWERWIYECIPEKLVHSNTYKRKELTESIIETRIDIDGQNQQQSHEVNVYESGLRVLHRILPKLVELLGMKHIYELRVRHVQALELQSLVFKHFQTTFSSDRSEFWDYIFLKEKFFMKAVRAGNHELIEYILREHPRFLLLTDSDSRSLFSYAVLYRQPRIFSLIYDLEAKEELINMLDESGNTLLHMAGMLELATDQIERIPGVALQMRRELQWFKEIEGMSSLFTREMKNNSGETAKEIFTKNHKNMKDAGEKWMKETASSSSVVGTLIITITFAAAITVPGGNNGDKGFPIFSDKPIFLLFVISNALSFVSSIAAILTFLVILTTSYAENDFISSLPRKMAIGLSTLSFSIATMMIAFCAALFIMIPGQLWITILIICLASISVIWFLLEKYRNLVEMTKSAYGPHMFDKKLKSGPSKGMPLPPDIEA